MNINTQVKEVPEFDALYFTVDRQKYPELVNQEPPEEVQILNVTDRKVEFLFPIEEKESIQRYIH
jgi:hypothetical protein